MKHAVAGFKLGRDTNSRKALLKNLASDLMIRGAITTTLVKAKFARGHIEKLVTAAKSNKLNSQRRLASHLTHPAFTRLRGEIAPGFAKRPGGYTRIIKLGQRQGDAAPLARLEFLEWEKTSSPKVQKSPKAPAPKTKNNQRKSVVNQRKSAL